MPSSNRFDALFETAFEEPTSLTPTKKPETTGGATATNSRARVPPNPPLEPKPRTPKRSAVASAAAPATKTTRDPAMGAVAGVAAKSAKKKKAKVAASKEAAANKKSKPPTHKYVFWVICD